MNRNYNTHIYSIISILILSFALINILRDEPEKAILIDGDGSGHYAWLPSIFIYKTLDFKDIFENEKTRKGLAYQGHNYHEVNSVLINKFPPGTAFLLAPFFLLAIIVSSIFQLPFDGYNIVFQYSVGIGALFWAFIGLVFLYKLLLSYKINSHIAFFLVLSSFFATNLFAYTFLMPAFSHVYSFALISALLYFVRKYFLGKTVKSLLTASIILALILSVRPVNVLVIVFLPFLASDSKTFYNSILEKFKDNNIIYAVAVFLIALAPYTIINYIQTGHLIYFAYENEGFYWTDPQIMNFLFSFRKGWFVYTPFFLLIFPSLFFIFKKNRFEFLWFSLFFLILIYVLSSWWNWFFGDSFGMRPMADYTSIFILLIALYYSNLKGIIRRITLIFIILTIGLNIIQSYQYAKGIIHPDSMNKEAYFHVFLKTDLQYSGSISGGPEYYYGEMAESPFYEEFNDFESDYLNWAKLWDAEIGEVFSGKKSVLFNNEKIYSPSFNWEIPDSLIGSNNLYVKIETMYFEPLINSAKNALFIIDIQDELGKTVFYKGANLKQIPNDVFNQWKKASTGFKLPLFTKEHHLIKIYIWNVQKTHFLIDDLEVGFYEYD